MIVAYLSYWSIGNHLSKTYSCVSLNGFKFLNVNICIWRCHTYIKANSKALRVLLQKCEMMRGRHAVPSYIKAHTAHVPRCCLMLLFQSNSVCKLCMQLQNILLIKVTPHDAFSICLQYRKNVWMKQLQQTKTESYCMKN